MQKVKQKGKAAAEAAAFPVMEESKMETTILYHHKRKPPRLIAAAQTTCKQEHDTALVYRYAPHYTPGNERTALSARLSRKHTPKSLTTQ